MRTFNVSVQDQKVACKPEKMHVPPHTHEDISVCLEDKWVGLYKLKVLLTHGASLSKQRLNAATVVLHDINTAPGDEKFTIELQPLKNSVPVESLDPIIVNE